MSALDDTSKRTTWRDRPRSTVRGKLDIIMPCGTRLVIDGNRDISPQDFLQMIARNLAAVFGEKGGEIALRTAFDRGLAQARNQRARDSTI